MSGPSGSSGPSGKSSRSGRSGPSGRSGRSGRSGCSGPSGPSGTSGAARKQAERQAQKRKAAREYVLSWIQACLADTVGKVQGTKRNLGGIISFIGTNVLDLGVVIGEIQYICVVQCHFKPGTRTKYLDDVRACSGSKSALSL